MTHKLECDTKIKDFVKKPVSVPRWVPRALTQFSCRDTLFQHYFLMNKKEN